MDPIPRERMGNATSLFNLMRNLGGSIGIAVTGTMLSRYEQANAVLLGSHVTALNPASRSRSTRRAAASWPRAPTPPPRPSRAYAALDGLVHQQAAMVSFVNLFRGLGILFVLIVPLVLLMRRPRAGTRAGRRRTECAARPRLLPRGRPSSRGRP